MVYTVKDISKLGTILGVWAHPDDDVFSSAGLMATANHNGQKIIIITATYGDAGETANEQKWPKENLADIRKEESAKALELLGEIEQHWLGYNDGKLAEVNIDEAVDKIVSLVVDKKIDTIITFEEHGITGHDDHKTVHKWSNKLAKKLHVKNLLCAVESQEFYDEYGKELDKKYNIYFKTDKPRCVCKEDADLCFELPEKTADIKQEALKAHASQTAGIFADAQDRKAILAMSKCECFVLVDFLNNS